MDNPYAEHKQLCLLMQKPCETVSVFLTITLLHTSGLLFGMGCSGSPKMSIFTPINSPWQPPIKLEHGPTRFNHVYI